MNIATTMTPGTDLLAAVEKDTSVVLVNAEAFEAWLIDLRAKVEGLDSDVSVRKNREAIREAAAEIGRKKASVERDRLRLTKEWRDLTAKVNAAGKDINEKLEGLQAEVRQPLTVWEEREKLRISNCERLIAEIKASAIVTLEDTAEAVRDRGTEVYLTKIDAAQFGDMYENAMQARSDTIGALKLALDRLTREEAERAELARFRAAEAEREAKEAEQREKAEREAAELAEIERQKARVAAEEQARKDREAQIAKDAADRAEREMARIHEEALQEERDRLAVIERHHAAHLAQLALEKEEREQAEADRIAAKAKADAEEARLAKNRAHRAQYMGEAKIAIMAAANAGHAVERPITEAAAVAIVRAIVAGSIPHIALDFRA